MNSRSPRQSPQAVCAAPPSDETFRADVLCGLARTPKEIPCKWLYDQRGSRLFEQICELEEYYPTRTEIGILRRDGADMARCLGPQCMIIEPGSGSGIKTALLLERLDNPVAYVPIDISPQPMEASAAALREQFEDLEVLPVCADFTADFSLPRPAQRPRRRVVFFPGSTIGNFSPTEARRWLHRMGRLCGSGGGILIGVDTEKDRHTLEAAYNDRAGVTARFNLNLLRRINRELDGDFDLSAFEHRATYNNDEHCIEMHLVSRRAQRVRVAGQVFTFAAGETLRTERSYKYRPARFRELAARAGLEVRRTWTDPREHFSVQYLRVP